MNLITHLHPATVHFPIALLLCASAAGLLYLYYRPRTELRILVWWLMLPGWIATVVAVLSGLLAQRQLPPQPLYKGLLNWHISTGLALLVVYGTLLYLRWLRRAGRQSQNRVRHEDIAHEVGAWPQRDSLLDDSSARLWITILLVFGALLVVASGWNGGRLVYEWGVNVK